MNITSTSNPIFKQAQSALQRTGNVRVHVPLNQLTGKQQAEYLRKKFGLTHGPGKKKRKRKK